MKQIIILITVLCLLLTISNIYAENYVNLNSEDSEIDVIAPISVSLNSDYTVSPKGIIIQRNNSTLLIGGQTILSKYIINNKLNYSLNTRISFLINKDIDKEDYKLIMPEAIEESECLKKNGEVLNYNNQKIIIKKEDSKDLILCNLDSPNAILKDNTLTVNINLKPGVVSKYLLFITTPYITPKEYKLTQKIDIERKSKDYLKDSNESLNNFNFGNVRSKNLIEEPNYTEDYKSKNLESKPVKNKLLDNTKQNIDELKNKKSKVKDKSTGFISLGFSSLLFILLGLLIVIAFATVISKKKERRLSDV